MVLPSLPRLLGSLLRKAVVLTLLIIELLLLVRCLALLFGEIVRLLEIVRLVSVRPFRFSTPYGFKCSPNPKGIFGLFT